VDKGYKGFDSPPPTQINQSDKGHKMLFWCIILPYLLVMAYCIIVGARNND
jgi:hypothetical protein